MKSPGDSRQTVGSAVGQGIHTEGDEHAADNEQHKSGVAQVLGVEPRARGRAPLEAAGDGTACDRAEEQTDEARDANTPTKAAGDEQSLQHSRVHDPAWISGQINCQIAEMAGNPPTPEPESAMPKAVARYFLKCVDTAESEG